MCIKIKQSANIFFFEKWLIVFGKEAWDKQIWKASPCPGRKHVHAVPLQPDWTVAHAYLWSSWRPCTRFQSNSAPSLKNPLPTSNHWHYCSVLPRENESFHCRSGHRPNTQIDLDRGHWSVSQMEHFGCRMLETRTDGCISISLSRISGAVLTAWVTAASCFTCNSTRGTCSCLVTVTQALVQWLCLQWTSMFQLPTPRIHHNHRRKCFSASPANKHRRKCLCLTSKRSSKNFPVPWSGLQTVKRIIPALFERLVCSPNNWRLEHAVKRHIWSWNLTRICVRWSVAVHRTSKSRLMLWRAGGKQGADGQSLSISDNHHRWFSSLTTTVSVYGSGGSCGGLFPIIKTMILSSCIIRCLCEFDD
jgi:hypothetical protein